MAAGGYMSQMDPAFRQTDMKFILNLNLTARGAAAGSKTDDLIDWLEKGNLEPPSSGRFRDKIDQLSVFVKELTSENKALKGHPGFGLVEIRGGCESDPRRWCRYLSRPGRTRTRPTLPTR